MCKGALFPQIARCSRVIAVGPPSGFIFLMQLTSFGMAAFGGVWLAGVVAQVRLSTYGTTLAVAQPVTLILVLTELPLPPSEFLWSMVLVAALIFLAVTDRRTSEGHTGFAFSIIALGILHAATLGTGILLNAAVAAALGLLACGLGNRHPGPGSVFGRNDVLLIAASLAWIGPARSLDLALVTVVMLAALFAIRKVPLPEPDACLPTRAFKPALPSFGPAVASATLALWFGGPVL